MQPYGQSPPQPPKPFGCGFFEIPQNQVRKLFPREGIAKADQWVKGGNKDNYVLRQDLAGLIAKLHDELKVIEPLLLEELRKVA